MNEMILKNNRFADAIAAMTAEKLPEHAFKQVGTNADGSDMLVVAANFKFSVEKGKRTEIEISNPDVAKILYEIQGAAKATDEIDKFVARKLYQLSTYDEIIKRMNFDSAIDLAVTVFGMSKDWASKRLRVGQYFITDEFEFVPVIPATWTVSHVQELLQHLPKDDNGNVVDAQVVPFVAGLLQEGTIMDGMTTKKLRDVLNEKFPNSKRTRKALKEGKKEGEKKEGTQATASDVDVTNIDRLAEMSVDAKVGVILNAVQTIATVFPSIDFNEKFNDKAGEMVKNVEDCLEFLREIARACVK